MSVDIDAVETYKCPECETEINPDVDDCRWSPIAEEYFCWGCYESDVQYASTVVIVEDNNVRKYMVADNFIEDEYGDEPRGIEFTRTYHSTDGWRGYHATSIDGWTDVLDGWTTGAWGDAVGNRKANFNSWAEDIIGLNVYPPCPVAIVSDPTSNVFSIAITVLVPENSVDLFRDWLGEDADYLNNALS